MSCKNNFSSAKIYFSGTHTHCLDIVLFFNLSPENDILNKTEDIGQIKSYATSDFDASPKELQLWKTSVDALELILSESDFPCFPRWSQNWTGTVAFFAYISGRACKIKVILQDYILCF